MKNFSKFINSKYLLSAALILIIASFQCIFIFYFKSRKLRCTFATTMAVKYEIFIFIYIEIYEILQS